MSVIRMVLAMALAIVPLSTAQASPDEACLAYQFEGRGSDVFLIPGLASSPQVWDGTIAALSDRYRFHRITVPGLAETPANPAMSANVPADTVQRITDYIACRGAKKPVLIGHSMGGLTALMLARDLPDTFERVIVIDALPFYPLLFDQAATVDSVRAQAQAFAAMIRTADDARFAAVQRQTTATLVQSPEQAERIAQWSITSDRATLANAVEAVMLTDLRPDLPAITTPVTIIYAHNAAFPAERAGAIYTAAYAGLPNARLEPVANSRHFIMLDQPDKTIELIDEALAELY